MRNFCIFLLTAIFCSFSAEQFKTAQLKYPRVKTAYQEKETSLKQVFREKKISFNELHLYIRIFKKEKEAELWARAGASGKFTLIKTYAVCESSGNLGPKRKKGDHQTPEGFYHIDRFNPQSSYYLSLGINYPNASDRILGHEDPGGDIFIHGKCVTIGCVPLTDEHIKELYLLAVEARDNGQKNIPVHIFPCRMTQENMDLLRRQYHDFPTLLRFWQNIRPGYTSFEASRIPAAITISGTGQYVFKE